MFSLLACNPGFWGGFLPGGGSESAIRLGLVAALGSVRLTSSDSASL